MTRPQQPPVYLVDGSNVARSAAWSSVDRGDDELRRRLVDAVCGWAARERCEVRLVFDGAGPQRSGRVRVSGEVEVVGSGRAEGDQVIRSNAARLRRERRGYWVVSSDRALQELAGAGAVGVIDAAAFVSLLRTASTLDDGGGGDPTEAPPGSKLGDSVDADVRSRLERLRRGDR